MSALRALGVHARVSAQHGLVQVACSGARAMSSSTAKKQRMKAFPIFQGRGGVQESNDLYIHSNIHGAPVDTAHQEMLAEAERLRELEAKTAADAMLHQPEIPILLESVRIRSLPTLRMPSGHLSRPAHVPKEEHIEVPFLGELFGYTKL
jgi:hypothetical protein